MENTNNLSLPYIAPAQAQKHVTHNEAIRQLDTIVMLSVISRTLNTPPTNPAEGERYIIANTPQDIWLNHTTHVVTWVDNTWSFSTPKTGWLCWSEEDESILVFENNQWQPYSAIPDKLEQISAIGINTQASQSNRLSIAANSTLLTNEGSDHRLVINKQATENTASVVFQNNYSGRAEFGLNGDDNFSLKVSPNGSNFLDALIIDTDTGKATFPKSNILQNYATNLYGDNGRFAGNNSNSVTIGNFHFPQYFVTYNNTLISAHGKFIHNNATYGGAQNTLNPDIDDLIIKIKDSNFRRYGVEFWVAKMIQGTGTNSSPFTHEGITAHISLFTSGLKTPNMTFHSYLKALTSTILIKAQTGQIISIDGVEQTGSVAITVADGWRSITITDSAIPRQTAGYQPNILRLYAEPNTQYLMACPALMGGITKIDPDSGVIAGANSWPA